MTTDPPCVACKRPMSPAGANRWVCMAGTSCGASGGLVWVPWAPCDYRPVILESPYAGQGRTRTRNAIYLKAAMLDSIKRGEAPFASHGLYPQVLNDNDPDQRATGIALGFVWMRMATGSVIYADHGITPGMQQGIDVARRYHLPVEYRRLYPDPGPLT